MGRHHAGRGLLRPTPARRAGVHHPRTAHRRPDRRHMGDPGRRQQGLHGLSGAQGGLPLLDRVVPHHRPDHVGPAGPHHDVGTATGPWDVPHHRIHLSPATHRARDRPRGRLGAGLLVALGVVDLLLRCRHRRVHTLVGIGLRRPRPSLRLSSARRRTALDRCADPVRSGPVTGGELGHGHVVRGPAQPAWGGLVLGLPRRRPGPR